MEEQNSNTIGNIDFKSTKRYLYNLFNVYGDAHNTSVIVESVTVGSVFKGVNLWALICAIFIASLGLNMNSAAVIIGAMLVSPLMGPIIAIGLSVATFNITLLKQAWKNLLLFVAISLLISTFYFFVSPMREPTNELIARTFPTIYDVLIALFGGTAGMIGSGQKEKGNIIPGVAIATALMPPLCTAGYGIATLNISFFMGAMYLFLINTVMIAFSAYIVSKLVFRIPQMQYPNPKRAKQVNRYILIIMLATILPSIFLAYRLVLSTAYQQKVDLFIQKELTDNNIIILKKNISYKSRTVDLFLLTLPSQEKQAVLQKSLTFYNLPKTKLMFKSAENLLKNQEQKLNSELQNKNMLIAALEDSILTTKKSLMSSQQEMQQKKDDNIKLAKQLNAIDPSIIAIGISPTYTTSELQSSSIIVVRANKRLSASTKSQVERFLKIQMNGKKFSVYYE